MRTNKLPTVALLGVLGLGFNSNCTDNKYVLSNSAGSTTANEKASETYLRGKHGEDYKCRDWKEHPWLGIEVEAEGSAQGVRSKVAAATHCDPVIPPPPDTIDAFQVVLDSRGRVILTIVSGPLSYMEAK